MEIPVYSTKWDKINLVATHLMSGPTCGWLILVGPGGDGKSMATNEAIKLWRRSLGEDVEERTAWGIDLCTACNLLAVLPREIPPTE